MNKNLGFQYDGLGSASWNFKLHGVCVENYFCVFSLHGKDYLTEFYESLYIDFMGQRIALNDTYTSLRHKKKE